MGERLGSPVRTKLLPPVLRDDLIVRERLLDAVHDSLLTHRLTLVSAPPGYGKTTLLASLPFAFPELSLAWLSVDREDNDPGRFLASLVAALNRLHPECGTATSALSTNLDILCPDLSAVVGTLLNEVLDHLPEPCVLVLDDLHAVTEPKIFEVLDYLLEHLPAQMHLAVATRHHLPLSLSRLRARRQLADVDLADLRFTLAETEELLKDKLRLTLPLEHVAVLQKRTEGWPAGICLTVNSLVRDPDPRDRDAFMAQLGSTDRHIFEFLADEVLAGQERAVYDFLLQTSILDELSPALCMAVADRRDANSLLEELYRRNLFMVRVDASATAFRYHDLFKQFLLTRLEREMPDRLPELHRRAAQAETVPSRAVHHYLAAGAWDEAAAVIEQVGDQMLRGGSLATLRSWMAMLPEETRHTRPRLAHLLGRCAWMTWELDAAKAAFERARNGFEAAGDQTGEVESLVHLATCLSTMADFDGAAATTTRALAIPLAAHHRAQVLLGTAWVELGQRNWARSNAHLDDALALAEASPDPRTLQAIVLDFNLPFTVLPGGVDRAERLRRLLQTQVGNDIGPLQLVGHSLSTTISLWRGQWREAIRAGERYLELSQHLGGRVLTDFEVLGILATCHALQGDEATSDDFFEALFQRIDTPGTEAFTAPWMAGLLYILGRVRWLQGRLDEAREVYSRMGTESTREWPIAPVARKMMQGLLHISDRRYADAEQVLRQAAAWQDEMRFSTVVGNAKLLLSYLRLLRNRPDDAVAALGPVLADHERQGTPGLVLWEGQVIVPVLRLAVRRGVHRTFAAHVLDLFRTPGTVRPTPVPRDSPILTPREIDVLRLVADGLTDGQVARKLYISPRTVGRHLGSIYQKLGVPARAAATRKAVEQGLIEKATLPHSRTGTG